MIQQLLALEQAREPKSRQQQRILALLRSKEWISLPEILDLRIASYTRRLSDLRELGFRIECETKWVNGVRHSKYRLLPEMREGGGNGKE
jgi:hypothetical protein